MVEMKSEFLARFILFILLTAAVGIGVLGLTSPAADAATVELHARMPENGGWSLSTLYARVGQPLHLQMTSDDVLHTFAVGQSDKAPIELHPGEWSETTLVFDKPGRYTYYCTAWCGRNHWRMRGTIVVTGSGSTVPGNAGAEDSTDGSSTAEKPLYLRLGLDLDAPHQAGEFPAAAPSIPDGAALVARLPAWALDRQTYLQSSPASVWERLRAEPSLKDLPGAALWDAVAFLWSRQVTPARLAEAAQLYATNCAACHGESGQGDGVMVRGLPVIDYQDHQSMAEQRVRPPDFTDPKNLLGASPALLEGKMIRGGMGTGMPYWGPIFTRQQLDDLVSYIYTFVLK